MKPTVLLSPQGSTDSNDVWMACMKKGWESHRARRMLLPDPVPEVMCAYGKNYFCDIMADRAELALLDPPDAWLASLPREILGRKIRFCKAKDVSSYRGKGFFKPANDKVFEAGIFEHGTDVPLRYIDPECPCLVSEIVAFDIEVRGYCLDGDPVALQQYRLYGDRSEEEAHEGARAFIKDVLRSEAARLPSSVVLDVGWIDGFGWAVVEANPLYSCGIYVGVAVDPILDCILRASGPKSLLLDRDRPFLRV